MTKKLLYLIIIFIFGIAGGPLNAGEETEYTVGVGDILEVRILKPDTSTERVTVSPDGDISMAYIGSLKVKGLTISKIQQLIQTRLANGFLKYPVVAVSLIESHSRNFTISGEINRPGTYPLGDNTTVLKAISIGGGFTRFGSSSKVKVLRPRKDRPGYMKIDVDVNKVMDGNAEADIVLEPGDIVVVSEGFF